MIIPRRHALRALLPLLLASAATTTSYGFAEIARGSLLFQTNASATYDSYFLGTIDNAPDTTYSLYPSLRYIRNAGRGTITASTGVAFNRYEKNQDLDSDDLRANLQIDLPTVEGARFKGNIGLDYNEATIVDVYVNDRVVTQTFSGNLAFEYRLSDRTNLRESFGYSNTTRELYSDQEMLSNQVALTYKGFLRGTSLTALHDMNFTNTTGDVFTGGVGLDQQSHNFSLGLSRPLYGEVNGSLNYGYSILRRSAQETASGETKSTSSYISLSIDGPFLPRKRFPKLTSSASLSYSQPATAGRNDEAGKFFSGNLSLTWSARERTKLSIQASRSMDLSLTDLSIENNRVSAGFDQQFGRSTNLTGNAGYAWQTTRGTDREDRIIDANLQLSRTFNKYLTVGAGYTYQNNDTFSSGSQPGRFGPRDYDRHTVKLTASLTF